MELALNDPFLMRSILALSALHLARLHSDRSDHYHILAAHHQDVALPAQRYLINDIEQNMDGDNSQAVIIFATLIMAHSLAAPRKSSMCDNNEPYSIEEVTEWFFLLRGLRKILRVARMEIAKGPMAYQLRSVPEPIDLRWNPHDDKLADLENTISGEDSKDAAVYISALRSLRESYAMVYSPGQEIGNKVAISIWIDQVPQRFLVVLREARPQALILLAHLAVPLKWTPGCWYTEGAGERILRTVKDLLGDEWMDAIAWPCEICR